MSTVGLFKAAILELGYSALLEVGLDFDHFADSK